MKITRTSIITGITRTLDLPVTEDQIQKYENGALLQNAFPHLNAGDREFIKSGISSEEWDSLFGSEEEQEEEFVPDEDDDDKQQVGGGEDRHLDSFWESQNDLGGDW